jgi:C4-type Zn-finger protein
MDADLAYKNRIGIRLTELLINALETKQVDNDDASYLASYILEELKVAENSTEVLNFVMQLAQEWPIFAVVLSDPTSQSMLQQQHDEENATEIQEALQQAVT